MMWAPLSVGLEATKSRSTKRSSTSTVGDGKPQRDPDAGRSPAVQVGEEAIAGREPRFGNVIEVAGQWMVGGSATWSKSGCRHVSGTAYEALARPYEIEGQTVRITSSAGVSTYPVHGEDEDTLMKSANLALYEATHAGGNCYRTSGRSGS
jgi:hypothetical protein